MPVNDLFYQVKLFAVHGASQGQAFFPAVAADALIKCSSTVQGLHDFLGDLFVLFGVDRDHASPVHTVENGIHGLCCADNGEMIPYMAASISPNTRMEAPTTTKSTSMIA